jgi:hypothetical protein
VSGFADLIFQRDFADLPVDALRELAEFMKVSPHGSRLDLIAAVWSAMESSSHIREDGISRIADRILAGKTSVSWLRVQPDAQELSQRALGGTDNALGLPYTSAHSADQVLKALSDRENVWFRCLISAGQRQRFAGLDIVSEPDTVLATAKLDQRDGVLEVRCPSQHVRRVAAVIQEFLDLPHPFSPIQLEDSMPEQLADRLHGQLIEVDAELLTVLEMLTSEQMTAVMGLLEAISTYLANGTADDLDQIKVAAEGARQHLQGHASFSFLELVLSGMERMGVAANGDLRNQAFFKALRPKITHRSSYIRFPDPAADGVTQTIRIAVASKSIYFMSSATEKVISYVRANLFDALHASAAFQA